MGMAGNAGAPPVVVQSGAATENNSLIKRTFGKYLAMSILITLSATLGMMIDNVIAGNLLGSGAVAAIGMSLSVFMLFSGCAGIIETGAVALCARALGNRDAQRVNVLFSVSLLAALCAGVVLSVGGVVAADTLATLLGATTGQLHADTAAYLSGICMGAFAIVLLQLLMGFTRLDNAPQLGMVAIIGMSVCDVAFNLVAVCALGLGLWGMGAATALAYCVAVAICCTHFASKRNTLRLVNPLPHLEMCIRDRHGNGEHGMLGGGRDAFEAYYVGELGVRGNNANALCGVHGAAAAHGHDAIGAACFERRYARLHVLDGGVGLNVAEHFPCDARFVEQVGDLFRDAETHQVSVGRHKR